MTQGRAARCVSRTWFVYRISRQPFMPASGRPVAAGAGLKCRSVGEGLIEDRSGMTTRNQEQSLYASGRKPILFPITQANLRIRLDGVLNGELILMLQQNGVARFAQLGTKRTRTEKRSHLRHFSRPRFPCIRCRAPSHHNRTFSLKVCPRQCHASPSSHQPIHPSIRRQTPGHVNKSPKISS